MTGCWQAKRRFSAERRRESTRTAPYFSLWAFRRHAALPLMNRATMPAWLRVTAIAKDIEEYYFTRIFWAMRCG